MKPLVRVRGLSFSYADPSAGAPVFRRVLDGVCFDLHAGERLAVLGANGSGKSTLLACLTGLLRPGGAEGVSDGNASGGNQAEAPVLFYNGEAVLRPDRAGDLEKIRGLIAVVLQNPDDQIISSVVEEDAAFGPENLGLSGAELEERVRWALGRCNLNHLKKRAPRFLSGGEKQRLALAGALAMKTPVLALDEAVSMLDPRGREDFLSLLDELSGEGKTILHITHSLEEAFHCRRALVLHRGRLVFDGPPAELLPLGRKLEEWGFVLPGPAAFRRLVPALSAGTASSAVFSVEKTAEEIITALGGGVVFDTAAATDAAAATAVAPAAATGNAGPPLAAFLNVSHVYAGSGAGIEAVHFAIPQTGTGRIIALVGKSGTGKSTVLKHLNALLLPTEGRVFVHGEDTSDRKTSLSLVRRRAALSVQSPESALFEQYLADDVAAGPAHTGLSGPALVRRVRKAMEAAGLPFDEFADRKTLCLSGGEKRLAAIAGAAALESEILLLDEPLAALDGFHGEKILRLLRRLRDEGKTVIVSTHDMETAALADQVAVMTEAPASQAPALRGTLAAFGPPQDIFGRRWDEAWGLSLPWAAAVARRLTEAGVLPPGAVPLNAKELADMVKAAAGPHPAAGSPAPELAAPEVIMAHINGRTRVTIDPPAGQVKEMLSVYYREPRGWRKTILDWAETLIPPVITDPEGREVAVSRTSIRNIVCHGKGPLKILTIPHAATMLAGGVLFFYEQGADKQGRPERYFNYAYPLLFEGREWLIAITVKEDYNGKRFYNDEFIEEVKATGGVPSGAGPSTRGNLTHPSILNILRNMVNVKVQSAPEAEPPAWAPPPPPRRRRKKTGAELFRPVVFSEAARRFAAPGKAGLPGGVWRGGLKPLLFAAFAVLALAGPQPAAPLVVLALVLFCAAGNFGGAGPLRLLRGFAPLLPWLLLIGAIQFTFTRPRPPPLKAFALLFRTSALAGLVSLYAALTPLGEFLCALKRFFSVFRRFGLPVRDISLAAGIAFRFVPVLAEEAERIVAARLSRGGKPRRFEMFLSIIVPLFLRALERAETLAKAMVLRGYRRQ